MYKQLQQSRDLDNSCRVHCPQIPENLQNVPLGINYNMLGIKQISHIQFPLWLITHCPTGSTARGDLGDKSEQQLRSFDEESVCGMSKGQVWGVRMADRSSQMTATLTASGFLFQGCSCLAKWQKTPISRAHTCPPGAAQFEMRTWTVVLLLQPHKTIKIQPGTEGQKMDKCNHCPALPPGYSEAIPHFNTRKKSA